MIDSTLVSDPQLEETLTKTVKQWLDGKNLRSAEAKKWYRFKDKYWWNYLYIQNQWWGIEVDNNYNVRRVV